MFNRKNISRVVVAGVAATGGVAFADSGVDVSSVTAAITAAAAAIATVGAAVLSLHVGMKVYKWIRAAM